MSGFRRLIGLHYLFLVGLVVYAIWGYWNLPDRYAAHFNLAGEVDRWADKGGYEYWVLPLIAVALGLGLAVLTRFPRHYNYPQKNQVNRWPEERRVPIYNCLKQMMVMLALSVDLLFFFTLYSMLNSAGGEAGFPWVGFIGCLVLIPMMVIYYLVRISNLVERGENELKIIGWSPTT